MAELIATIFLFISLLGMGIILFRKIPTLVELPETPAELNLKRNLLRIKEKVKTARYFKSPPYEIFLQRILSKIRILTLKTEGKTANWLQRLREKSQKKKIQEDDNYWQELKNSKDQEKKI